jgi:hypothetical protein
MANDPVIASAPVGQAFTHNPQPLQRAGSTIGTGHSAFALLSVAPISASHSSHPEKSLIVMDEV